MVSGRAGQLPLCLLLFSPFLFSLTPTMAEAQSLPQPQPRQIAQYLHNAADQIALFENLPTFTNDQMLRENTRSIAALQEALQEVVRALNTIQNNMTTLNTTIETLQNNMNQEFARLNTKLDST